MSSAPQPITAALLELPPSAELARRLSGSPLLLLLDIDGTLAPIASTPEAAAVPQATRNAISRLVNRPAVHVALVTGRAAADGQRMVDVDGTWIIGNHGMERIDPDGSISVDPRVIRYQPDIAAASAALTESLADIAGVIVENKRWTLSVHYRLAEREHLPRVQRAIKEVAHARALRCIAGKEISELRPPVDVNKGTAALDLAKMLGVAEATGGRGAILCVGDDRTDEDAFRLLRAHRPDSVTIHVGAGTLANGDATAAELVLPDTESVRALLEWLATIR
jgi:trehalose-phosphatase